MREPQIGIDALKPHYIRVSAVFRRCSEIRGNKDISAGRGKVEAGGSIVLADLQCARISRFISRILKNGDINLVKIFDSVAVDLCVVPPLISN